jgi:hypothetical protein
MIAKLKIQSICLVALSCTLCQHKIMDLNGIRRLRSGSQHQRISARSNLEPRAKQVTMREMARTERTATVTVTETVTRPTIATAMVTTAVKKSATRSISRAMASLMVSDKEPQHEESTESSDEESNSDTESNNEMSSGNGSNNTESDNDEGSKSDGEEFNDEESNEDQVSFWGWEDEEDEENENDETDETGEEEEEDEDEEDEDEGKAHTRKTREYTVEERSFMVAWNRTGMSQRAVCKMFDPPVPQSSLRYIIDKYNRTGTVQNAHRCGRPRKLATERNLRQLERAVTKNAETRRAPLRESRNNLMRLNRLFDVD